MRFLGFRFLWGHKPKKADVFLLLLSRRRTKEGFPCGGRKGVARSERSILSPSTELERRRATSGRTTAVHKVTGLWTDAAGYLSLRPFRQQVGPVPTDGRGGNADAPSVGTGPELSLPLSLALGCKERGMSGSARRKGRQAGRRLWPDPLSGCQPEKTSAPAGISGRGAMLIREGKKIETSHIRTTAANSA